MTLLMSLFLNRNFACNASFGSYKRRILMQCPINSNLLAENRALETKCTAVKCELALSRHIQLVPFSNSHPSDHSTPDRALCVVRFIFFQRSGTCNVMRLIGVPGARQSPGRVLRWEDSGDGGHRCLWHGVGCLACPICHSPHNASQPGGICAAGKALCLIIFSKTILSMDAGLRLSFYKSPILYTCLHLPALTTLQAPSSFVLDVIDRQTT